MKLRLSAPVVTNALPRVAQWLAEFFQHHGVWAPAVRLLRSMSMRRKASLLLGVFVLTLSVLTGLTTQYAVDQLSALTQSREGLRFSDLAQKLEAAPTVQSEQAPAPAPVANTPSIGQLQDELLRTYAAMPQVHAATDAAMQSCSRRQTEAKAATNATPMARQRALCEQIAALLTLREGVSNASGLWREPEHGVATVVELSQETLAVLGRGITDVPQVESRLLALTGEQPPAADNVQELHMALAKQVAGVETSLSRLSMLSAKKPALGLATLGDKTVASAQQWLRTVEQSLLPREIVANAALFKAQSIAVLMAVGELRTASIHALDKVLAERRQGEHQMRKVDTFRLK